MNVTATPYTDAPAAYDLWKTTEDYEARADLIIDDPIRTLGNEGRRILDVVCGTGNSSFVFARDPPRV